MNYQSKVGYSMDFQKRQIIYFLITFLIMILLIMVFMPAPVNYVLSYLIAIIVVIFLGLGILVGKTLLGVRVKVEGENVKIYKADSFTLQPGNNELIFFYGKALSASMNILKSNISYARKITDTVEIRRIKKMDNVLKSFKINKFINILANKKAMQGIAFVSDYTNMVEIGVKNLNVKNLSSFGSFVKVNSTFGDQIHILNDTKIIVSVKNPDEFINSVKN